MSDLTTPAVLAIPRGAEHAAWDVVENDTNVDDSTEGLYECVVAALHAAAPHIVAAELRRLADQLGDWTAPPDTVLPDPRTLAVIVARLRVRATKLDGGAR